jgi:hypothetical protein
VIYRDSIINLKLPTEISVKDEHGRKVTLKLDNHESDGKVVSIYSPYWLKNRTSFPIQIRQSSIAGST